MFDARTTIVVCVYIHFIALQDRFYECTDSLINWIIVIGWETHSEFRSDKIVVQDYTCFSSGRYRGEIRRFAFMNFSTLVICIYRKANWICNFWCLYTWRWKDNFCIALGILINVNLVFSSMISVRLIDCGLDVLLFRSISSSFFAKEEFCLHYKEPTCGRVVTALIAPSMSAGFKSQSSHGC